MSNIPNASIPNIVNMNALEWREAHHSEHYTGWIKRLSSPAMDRRQGHMGVVIERLKPQSLSCPFNYHIHEDEFCLILNGKAMLRYGEKIVEVREGDAISSPRGERVAHQFYNHTNQTVDILMVGENLPYDVCYYPDSNKWSSRSLGKIGKFEQVDYWADEPDPPLLKADEL